MEKIPICHVKYWGTETSYFDVTDITGSPQLMTRIVTHDGYKSSKYKTGPDFTTVLWW